MSKANPFDVMREAAQAAIADPPTRSLAELKYEDKWLDIRDLTVDRNVQRAVRNEGKVEEFERNWNDNLAGIVTVSHRRDRSHVIVDGDHRTEAKKRRTSNNGQIFCRVFEGLTIPEEGMLFLALNPGNQPHLIDKYRVEVFTGMPQAVRIDKIVHSRGFVVDNQGGNGHINTVRALRELDTLSLKLEAEPHILDVTLLVISRAWGMDRFGLQNANIQGLGRLLAEYGDRIDLDILIDVLRHTEGSARGLLIKAKQMASIKGFKQSMAVADIVVDDYNKRLRSEKNKLSQWRYKR